MGCKNSKKECPEKDYVKDYCPDDLDCGDDIPICWKKGSSDKKGFCANRSMDPLFHLQRNFDEKPHAESITYCVSRLNAMDTCDSGKYQAFLNKDGDGDDKCKVECVDGYNGPVKRTMLMWFIVILLVMFVLKK